MYEQAPMALDIRSPMDLVYECFVKLGLRYVCVTKEGRYAGMVSTFPLHYLFLSNSNVIDTQEDICKIHAGVGRKGRAYLSGVLISILVFQHYGYSTLGFWSFFIIPLSCRIAFFLCAASHTIGVCCIWVVLLPKNGCMEDRWIIVSKLALLKLDISFQIVQLSHLKLRN
jgi:hypothetical protein